MYYKCEKNDDGSYIGADGERYALYAADGVSQSSRRYWIWVDTLDACLESFGLTYAPLPEHAPEN